MRKTRSDYHLAIRKLKRSANDLRKQRFLCKIESGTVKEFWNNVKRFSGQSNKVTNIVDGKTESNDICDIFADKYKAIFQSCPSSLSDIHILHKRVNDKLIQENVETICVSDMEKAFTRLKFNKSDGNHCCNSNHFKFAPKRLVVLFSLLFECMLYHGYTSEDLLYYSFDP